MIDVWKLAHHHYNLDPSTLLQFDVNPQRKTRGHSYKLTKPRCRTAKRASSFTHRIVNVWNGLPDSVVSSDSVNSFKSAIDKYAKMKNWYYTV